MEAKYKFSKDAKQDLKQIYAYGYHMWGEEQADKYFHALFDSFAKIAKQPEAYQKVDYIKQGYRRCTCGVDSIYFRIAKHQVEIMAIIGHQDTGGF